jgi:uncharacterized protein
MTDRYSIPKSREETQVDAGLRGYMSSVYNRMTAGVLVTALVAMVVGSSPDLMRLFLGGPQMYLVIFAPLAIVWFGFNPRTMNSRRLAVSFFLLSALYGITFSTIGYIYTKESIAQSFFVATAMFAGLSIFGYTTKKNLDGLGSFAVMGVIGLLVASIMNMFFQNPMMSNVISGIGIIAFSGITAWYTQLTKEMYNSSAPQELNSRMAWAAALQLYISFIAIFQYLLQLFGNRN